MAFSATLTLNDLNDYLSPSQACIRPVEVEEPIPEPIDHARTAISIDPNAGGFAHVALPDSLPSTVRMKRASPSAQGDGGKKKLKKAEISLNDCLACSGCITTSQELLLQTHSLTPLHELLAPSASDSPRKLPFLTVSPQSLSSLSASLPSPVALPVMLHRLRHHLPSLGIPHVADLTFARHISLSETVREFEERRAGHGGGLPMLASACPGWICYAEKAHGEVLGKIAKGRSAMGVMGGLVKGWWATRNAVDASSIFHISVQPCYDRKLESSRSQFISSQTSQPETDLVLTTGELDSFLRDAGRDLSLAVPGEDVVLAALSPGSSRPLMECEGFPSMLDHPGSSSDSYLHSLLFHYIASYPPDSLTLSTNPIRGSPDYIEYTLATASSPPSPDPSSSATSSTYLPLPPPGITVFRAAKCYGFKNLQNVVRKTKTSSLASSSSSLSSRRAPPKGYDYVEVMACPSGCVNGGGQLKPVALLPSPPTPAPPRRDEEGFVRPWETTDVALAQLPSPSDAASSAMAVDQDMRWSTKAWVARVEAIYWGREPPPLEATTAAVLPLKPSSSVAALEREEEDLGRAGRAHADEVEREVREAMRAWEVQRGGAGDEWARTTYEALKAEDDGLLGGGVVW